MNVPALSDQVINILPHMPSQLQLYPVKLKQKLEYRSHYIHDVIRKDCVIVALTWLKEHNDHYRNIEINKDWCNIVSDDGLSQILIQDGDPDANFVIEHNIQEESTPSRMVNANTSPEEVMQQFSKFNTNDVTPHTDSQSNNKKDNHDDNTAEFDTKLAEDQAAINQRQELTGDPLPTVIQIDNMENNIYQYAPGENNIPKYVLMDNDFEILAFPDLFPYGPGAYNSEERQVKLPIWKYFQQQLLNLDGPFAQNIVYLFCAQHIVDPKHIQNESNLAMKLSRCRTQDGDRITAGILCNPQEIQQLERNQQAYKFLRNIRGSPPY